MAAFDRVTTYHDILKYEIASNNMGQHWDQYLKAIRRSAVGGRFMDLTKGECVKYFVVHWIFSDLAPEQGTRPLTVEGILDYCLESYFGAALARRYRNQILARISIEEMTAYLAEIDSELAR